MRINRRHLARATQLYARARYRQALRLLEPEILAYQDSERYFLLLGLCCIRCQNVGDAITYLERGQRLNGQNSEILQTLAICAYLQNNSADSIAHLLTILEDQPKNRPAAEFLQYIGAHIEQNGRGGGGRGINSIRPFLPAVPYLMRRVIMIVSITLASITLAMLAIGLVELGKRIADTQRDTVVRRVQNGPLTAPPAVTADEADARDQQQIQPPATTNTADAARERRQSQPASTANNKTAAIPAPPARVGVEEVVSARKSEQHIDFSAQGEYVFNDEQINTLLNTIESEFLAGNDNRACVAINRILNSNAHGQIKQRMIFFSSYLIEPDFSSIFDGYSYETVRIEPRLYNSCYVKWRGAVANITVQEGGDSPVSEFDFLIGYDSGDVLQGIIPSVSDIAYDFRINDAYEVVAQVRNIAERGGIQLYITDIRPLYDEE